jgi:hypothetical protein
MSQLITNLTLPFLLTFLSVCAVANESHESHMHHHAQSDDHEILDQSSHVHGVVELTVALEGNLLEIGIESPANNIVGFEHQAATDEEVTTAMRAKKILETSDQLFTFIGTDCDNVTADVDLAKLFSQQLGKNSHSEVHASYTYECINGEQLAAITVNLASYFEKIETISARWLTEDRQGAIDLTASVNQLQLR